MFSYLHLGYRFFFFIFVYYIYHFSCIWERCKKKTLQSPHFRRHFADLFKKKLWCMYITSWSLYKNIISQFCSVNSLSGTLLILDETTLINTDNIIEILFIIKVYIFSKPGDLKEFIVPLSLYIRIKMFFSSFYNTLCCWQVADNIILYNGQKINTITSKNKLY